MHVKDIKNYERSKIRIIGQKRNEKCAYVGNIKPDYNVTSKTDVKIELKNWLKNYEFDNACAITFTMKQNIYRLATDDKYFGYQDLDFISASQNLKHFLNKINGKFFGSRKSKKKDLSKCKRLKCFPFFEGRPNGNPRLHYHIIIEKPPHISDDNFINFLKISWKNTDWGDQQTHIEKIYNYDGWLKYCSKYVTTNEGNLNIDFENLWLGAQSLI